MARKKKKPQIFIVFCVAFIAVLFLSLDIGGFLRPLRSSSDLILNPVRYWFSNQGRIFSTFFRDLTSISSLRQENIELQSQIYDLQSELVELNSVEEENSLLRDQLELPDHESYDLVQAHIIGGDLRVSAANNLIIDKGTSSGINQGDVVVYSKYFIGIITETTDYSSVVTMISSGNLNIPAIAENNRTKGIVVGDINTGLVMEKVLREESLDEGEKILTSGISGYPEDLILGEVIEIEGKDTDVEKRALLKILIDIQTIEDVFVINVEKV